MQKIILGLILASIAIGVHAQTKTPVLHIEDWNDIKCETSGNPAIRLFPDLKQLSITCE